MIKKIDVLGLKLDNYTVREAICQVEDYLDSNVLNTIEKVTTEMLLESERDPAVRDAIANLDLSVIGEKEILQMIGEGTLQHLEEIAGNDFVYEFFKRVERNKKSIFLLAETEEKLVYAKEVLAKEFSKLIFVGEYALENCVGDLEAVINDLNVITPDVIVSVLPSPLQEHFLVEHKDKMDATIWFGMGESISVGKRQRLRDILRGVLHRARLRNSIERYNKDSKKESEMEEDNEA